MQNLACVFKNAHLQEMKKAVHIAAGMETLIEFEFFVGNDGCNHVTSQQL